jgi:hypothetical protein
VPNSTGFDLTNLLLGLAWLGELDRRQIRRLWFVGKSESTVEKTLARLNRDGVITKRAWSIHDEERGVTTPQLVRWSLTPDGHALVRSSAQYPTKPVQVRQQRLIAHDARTTEAIVQLIEIGRLSQMSGIYVSHELRLHPKERRPVCDALVVLQIGVFDRPNLVPWSRDPALAYEGKLRFAIEVDNDTEPGSVFMAKAKAYRQIDESLEWRAWWVSQYGELPLPLWVAPTPTRAAAIHAQWVQAWPRGQWLITDDAEFARGRLVHRHSGSEERIVMGFDHHRPALPPQPPPLPLLPAPAKPSQATEVPKELPAETEPTAASPHDQPSPNGEVTPSPHQLATVPVPIYLPPLVAPNMALARSCTPFWKRRSWWAGCCASVLWAPLSHFQPLRGTCSPRGCSTRSAI